MDGHGVYYDATRSSDLELILQNTDFDSTILMRASRLRERIVLEGLTKYNIGETLWHRPTSNGRVILVPGQVESDASIRFGAPGIARNLDLLKAVRSANPEARVIYKPHPDVVAGLRRGGKGENEAAQWCDEIVIDVSMATLLDAVDEVHVITSLAGFEALLRGKAVTCYGQPFYAGWGLSVDILPNSRRTRRLSIDELVAGVLILYPTYVSRTTGLFTTPERALEELLTWRENGERTFQLWRKVWRWAMRMGLGK
jgi:capsular polysaccharide export protein